MEGKRATDILRSGATNRSTVASVMQLLFVIRLAPYPYNLMNALLATTRISLQQFAGATALSLGKLITHVVTGAHLVALVDAIRHPTPGKVAIGVIGGLFGVGLALYLYLLGKQAVAQEERDDLSRQTMIETDEVVGGLADRDIIILGSMSTSTIHDEAHWPTKHGKVDDIAGDKANSERNCTVTATRIQ